jgi:hypothetical protein
MRIISEVRMTRKDFNAMIDLIDHHGVMDNVRSDIAIAFSKELIKNVGLLATETLQDSYGGVVVFKMEAIVIKMDTFKRLRSFFSEIGLSPDHMEKLRKIFIEEL